MIPTTTTKNGSPATASDATRIETEPADAQSGAPSKAKRACGLYANVRRALSSSVEDHGHAVLYGIVGFVAAALILIIGFWPTVLLAVFATVGAAIGAYRDGNRTARAWARSLLDRFNQ